MKIAITDACIFIDLYELGLTSQFFGLKFEFHTSVDVFNELYPEQKEVLRAFISVARLTLHNILDADRKLIKAELFPNSLSESDKTVLFLAKNLNAIVLSSDKRMRLNAKVRSIEYHGMLWIFDKLIESSLISYKDATDKLHQLINSNIIYQNNSDLIAEMNKRLKEWQKQF